MIETRLVRQFVAVAEELHFHQAAQRLHMAQPPLSQAISRLEGKLGFSLFIRDKREVKLTPAGSAFLSAAYRTLKELEQGVEHARQVAAGVAGKLTITSVSISGYPSLLNSLRQFRQELPQVQLVIREMPSAKQADAIVAGEADIAFRRRLPMTAANIETRLVLDEQIVIALPADHPRAGGGPVQLADFAEDDFVFTPPGLGIGYYSQLIALCDAAGFFPKVVQEAAQMQTLVGLVACGFGVALVPESIANTVAGDKVVFRALAPVSAAGNPAVGLYMSWHAHNPSPLIERFMALLDFSHEPHIE